MPWKECHIMDERVRFVARISARVRARVGGAGRTDEDWLLYRSHSIARRTISVGSAISSSGGTAFP